MNYEIYQKKIDLTELTVNKARRFLHTKKYPGGVSIDRIDESFPLKPSLIHHYKGVLKGTLGFMQYFKFENWRIRFLMPQTGSVSFCMHFSN